MFRKHSNDKRRPSHRKLRFERAESRLMMAADFGQNLLASMPDLAANVAPSIPARSTLAIGAWDPVATPLQLSILTRMGPWPAKP